MKHSPQLHPPQGKKRELTSPEFDIDAKKNKPVPITSTSEAITDLDLNTELEPETMSAEKATLHIIIPESEMLKLKEMLKGTFQNQIVGLVNGIVQGVVDGLQNQVKDLETTNRKIIYKRLKPKR